MEQKTCSVCGKSKSMECFEVRVDVGLRRGQCKLCRKAIRRRQYEKNKDLVSEQAKRWREENIDRWREGRAEYYQNNKDAFAKRTTKWVDQNRDKVNAWQRERRKQPYYKLREAYRSLMRRLPESECDSLGYSRKDLRDHMESLFRDGMSWENHGEWEIDHIKPVKAFWDEGVIDPKTVNALSNLQPLWKKENRKKSSTWVDRKGQQA